MAPGGAGEPALYSVRMRAARGGPHERGGEHVSGAERIVAVSQVSAAAGAMVRRALASSLGEPDFVQVTVERLTAEPVRVPALPVATLATGDPAAARAAAVALLVAAGVAEPVAREAVRLLASGPGPGGTNMRGAALLDAATGRRLEPDPARGVRVTRVDLAPEARRAFGARLRRAGLGGRRVAEALVLASKVAWAGVLAELCWSDDPDYTTGYAACRSFGYVRLPNVKPAGWPRGGRVFFLAPGTDVPALVRRLEEEAVLVEGVPRVRAPVAPSAFLEEIARAS